MATVEQAVSGGESKSGEDDDCLFDESVDPSSCVKRGGLRGGSRVVFRLDGHEIEGDAPIPPSHERGVPKMSVKTTFPPDLIAR